MGGGGSVCIPHTHPLTAGGASQRVSREMLKTLFSCREMQFYDILFIKSLEDDGVKEMAVRHQESSGLTKHPGPPLIRIAILIAIQHNEKAA